MLVWKISDQETLIRKITDRENAGTENYWSGELLISKIIVVYLCGDPRPEESPEKSISQQKVNQSTKKGRCVPLRQFWQTRPRRSQFAQPKSQPVN